MKSSAILFFVFSLGAAFHLQGQDSSQAVAPPRSMPTDTVIQFHFVPGVDMFYARYKENETGLRSFMELLSGREEQISQGKAIVKVEGFCASRRDRKKNLALAKTRSNRVKSYFITHAGLEEANYQTVNRDTLKDGHDNVVRLSILYPLASVASNEYTLQREDTAAVEGLPSDGKETVTCRQQTPTQVLSPESDQPMVTPSSSRTTLFAIKTNLLYDLALTPNLELEVPIGRRWSINAEYQYGWWLRKNNTFCWQIEAGGLEGRYWLGNRQKRDVLTGWFVGLFSSGGMYDFQLKKDEGRQGEFYIMAGASAGYAMPVARNLHLEFSAGAGALVTNYRRYRVIDDQLFKQGLTMKYKAVLPLKAKISLVWTIKGKKEAKP